MEATNREKWKSVNGFANYEISNCGRVRNATTERMLKSSDDGYGYLKINLQKEGKSCTMKIHRLVAEAFVDNPEGKRCVDHIDSNRKNNNCENLRPATHAENNRNRSKRANASSSYYGVSWVKNREKWKAQISINGTVVNLGSFVEEKEAAAVFNAAALVHYKKFAKLNDLTPV